MEGHKHNRILILIIWINITDKCYILQKGGQIRLLALLLILDEHWGKLFDIIRSVFKGFGILIKIIHILCSFKHLLQKVRQRHFLLKTLLEMSNHIRKSHKLWGTAWGFLKLICTLTNLKGWKSKTCGNFHNITEHCITNLTLWYIDNTLQSYIVGRIVNNCHIGNNILDFLSVKETVSADNSMGNTAFG